MGSKDNDFAGNMNAKYLDASSLQDNASCQQHLENQGILLGDIPKNRMKVMAQMMPTFTFDPESRTTKPQKACTLPSSSFATYNNTSGICTMQNIDNVMIELANGQKPEDVIKGCVMKTDRTDENYKDGQAFSDPNAVHSFMENAYKILDYDTMKFIQALRVKLAELTAKRNQLRDVDLPRAFSEHMTASQTYTNLVAECAYLKNTYNYLLSTQPQFIANMNYYITLYKDYADTLKRDLPGYYRYYMPMFYDRNMRDLSYVTLYSDLGQSGNRRVLTSSTRGLGGFNDRASSIYLPPGMKATLYKHSGYHGSRRDFDYNSDYYVKNNFRSIGFNNMASSVIVQGQFKTQAKYNTRDFERRVRDGP